MKLSAVAILSAPFTATALAAASDSTSTAYQLRITNSQNTAINGTFITLKDSDTSKSVLGVWPSDSTKHATYQFKATPATDARFYELFRTTGSSQLMVAGVSEAMELIDAKNPASITIGSGERKSSDKWLFVPTGGATNLRFAQDANVDAPSGGAGSWRACKGDSANDYQLYWYDGKSSEDNRLLPP